MAEQLPDQPHHGEMHLSKGFRGFALGGKDTSRLENPPAMTEEGAVEQTFGGPCGIGPIHQHHVIGRFSCLSRPGDAVAHMQVEAGIAPAVAPNAGQLVLAVLHHTAVDFDHVEVLDA